MRERKVTPTNLLTLSVKEVIQLISERVLSDIPEGINSHDDLRIVEERLGRLANDYAYVMELLSYSRTYVRTLKRQGQKEAYEDMMDKRSALEDIASAVKMQYQAVSRMLTAEIQIRDENDMYEYRKARGYQ